jgi:hypothetical protein
VVRVCIVLWLAVFTIQSADLLTIVAPDSCTEEVQGSAADPCSDGCARCVCCARVPVFIPRAVPLVAEGEVARPEPVLPGDAPTDPTPRGIFHVPKPFLI